MNRPCIVYLPLCRLTFDMECAQSYFAKSKALLESMPIELLSPDQPLSSPEMLEEYVRNIRQKQPLLVLVQSVTFVDATFMACVANDLSCPIVLWGVREPAADGGRLRLNSLTGVYAAGNLLVSLGRKFKYIFGNPEEAELQAELAAEIEAVRVKALLRTLKVGVFGHFPSGFYFSNLEDTELLRVIGPKLIRLELAAVAKKAQALGDEEIQAAIDELKGRLAGTESLPAATLEQYGRIRTAYKKLAEEHGMEALATRCWPDCFTEWQSAVCTAISFVTDSGVVASCEADIGGAISMYIARQLTGGAPYFADPVALDEENNAIIYWHCGVAPCSLARKESGIRAGVHPNRKVGITMECGLKPGRVTVMRLGKGPEGFRMFLAGGTALDEPQKFLGTSVEVRVDGAAKDLVTQSVEAGWEAHFVIAYGDISQSVKALCRWLDIPVYEY